MNKSIKIIFALSVFAVAMAMVEAAAVVYLRELYYPSGFFIQSAKDLVVMPARILRVELWREAATIIMLAIVGFLAFSDWRKKFWAFVLAFSVWDLAYYLFLYVFIRWPSSLATPDVYFLIPWPWIGPVWIPLAIFILLMLVSLRLLLKDKN
ncbi:MAG: hypothetical protein A2745_01295 [Candidatus Harrisonbacteria bacterium RIFCSPHIGHO2_01_FULL_44_13]|uniref:Uncharacterized protein n=1 Tax=Candidatus Harrisonbacteria bacterium RIFCSPLOWO2_01_FULL_44_18 TaxID=1798407 RepID=A0A1G1ZPH5_9BACT|nr:MAG: hypothetical protein A2745_01295 [Candidatus Harrisonbacteria bacterium RIFCSPHIGHO2_01_FULL_44_13]OGY66375.1 MAG: hypothetical protein A3A16_03330 [Candidatus Harrisonbacteria bacterium RIFCSPLOWO2_01_FULL_44_18]